MTRVKRGKISLKRRRNVLRQTKGFRHARKSKERAAKDALLHAGAYALAHRRDKKGEARRVWQVKINASVRPLGLSYSRFMDALKKKNVALDRKVLATLAEKHPKVFEKVVEFAKN